MKRYYLEKYGQPGGYMEPSDEGDYVLFDEAAAEINKRSSRIVDLESALRKAADELNDLATAHWDMDDVQPGEREEIERIEVVLNEAYALLGVKR